LVMPRCFVLRIVPCCLPQPKIIVESMPLLLRIGRIRSAAKIRDEVRQLAITW
jgi:hypothetical protein